MNKNLSKWFFYYPSVLLKGELVPLYLQRYERFQWNSVDTIRQYQLEHVRALVKYALGKSPFYRELYRSVGLERADDIKSLEDFAELPAIDKAMLIQSINKINIPHLMWAGTKTTGGSTGQPVQIRKSPSALARERAATWRSYRWAGVFIGAPQARFWGVPHSGAGRAKANLTDFISNRIRVSAFDLDSSSLASHYRKMLRYRPEYLYGYVSAILEFARFLRKESLPPPPSLRAIITTSEVLSDATREELENVFGLRVLNEYGCGEVGSIAHECERGSLHIMSDNLLLETSAADQGELIVTDFFNRVTPLVRYRLGDFGKLSAQPCPCGRGLPVLESVLGRAYDFIKTSSGRTIHPEAVMYIFEGIQAKTSAFSQFQVVQTSASELQVLVVARPEWSSEIVNRIQKEVRRVISSDMETKIVLTDELQREKSGKMRIVKSLVQ